MFHFVSYEWFMRTQYIPEFVRFYKKVGRLWRVSDCEELVEVTQKVMMGMPLPRVLVFEEVVA